MKRTFSRLTTTSAYATFRKCNSSIREDAREDLALAATSTATITEIDDYREAVPATDCRRVETTTRRSKGKLPSLPVETIAMRLQREEKKPFLPDIVSPAVRSCTAVVRSDDGLSSKRW